MGKIKEMEKKIEIRERKERKRHVIIKGMKAGEER